MNQIDKAIIAESARWGDAKSSDAFTKDDHWIPELSDVRDDFFPYRTNIVIDQLLDEELFPSISAPIIFINNNEFQNNSYHFTNSVNVKFSNGSSTSDIYYTLNGTDPRSIGGDISSNAIYISSGSTVTFDKSAVIWVRKKKDERWGALKKIALIKPQTDFTNFKITELHYHPVDSILAVGDTVFGESYEFIEFKNTHDKYAVNLSGLTIDSAIKYSFPENYLLPPGAFFVVASKPNRFYDRYGRLASENYMDNFSNSSERVVIAKDSSQIIFDFYYSDDIVYAERADGNGPSMISVEYNPDGNPSEFDYWWYSSQIHGSPFKDDGAVSSPGAPIAIGTFNVEVFPNPTSDEVFIRPKGSLEMYSLQLHDIQGRTIFSHEVSGNHSVSLKSLDLNSGIYIMKLIAGEESFTKKIVLSRMD